MSASISEPAPRYLTHPEILPVVRGVALCILLSALDRVDTELSVVEPEPSSAGGKTLP